MSGRPVHLLTAAAIAAAASVASVSGASANCYSGCGGYTYAAPVAYYSAPVVFSYSYARPVTYAAPCSPCGYGSYGYGYSRPMYVVNQGPTYTDPVTLDAEPTPAYEGGYRRAYPYYSGGGVRWHRRHWYRGYGYGYRDDGYRGYGYRGYGRGLGLRSYGLRFGYRHRGYRDGYRFGFRSAVVPGARFAIRHPIVGPRGMMHQMHRGGMQQMHRGGMHQMHRGGMPRMHMQMHSPRHAGGMKPGVVHPHMGPGPRGPQIPKKLP